jgi:hypothetical protein
MIEWSRSTRTGCQAGLGVGDGECLGRDFNGRGIVRFLLDKSCMESDVFDLVCRSI